MCYSNVRCWQIQDWLALLGGTLQAQYQIVDLLAITIQYLHIMAKVATAYKVGENLIYAMQCFPMLGYPLHTLPTNTYFWNFC
jgi:hypothetical protein